MKSKKNKGIDCKYVIVKDRDMKQIVEYSPITNKQIKHE